MSKVDLNFVKPIMNAAGTLGFTPDLRSPIPWSEFGAFITNPISLRPRTVAGNPVVRRYPGGFLLHTGLPNPGFTVALKKYAQRWEAAPIPVIVHLIGDRPEAAQEMTRRLEARENVLAVELSFAPLLADDIILLAIEMCGGELPLIISLPPEAVLRVGAQVMQAGAAAISLSPPRGALGGNGGQVSGRLFGPAIFPGALEVVRSAAKIGLPCLGAGGVFTKDDIQAMLAAGATGVQIDAALWLPRERIAGLVG